MDPSASEGGERSPPTTDWVVVDGAEAARQALQQLDLDGPLPDAAPVFLPPPSHYPSPDGLPFTSESPPVVEGGAKGEASSRDRHPILPPASATVLPHLQPSTTEGGASSSNSNSSGPSPTGEVVVPKALVEGEPMLKVSAKKVKQRVFKLDPDKGTLEWESKRGGKSTTSQIRPLFDRPKTLTSVHVSCFVLLRLRQSTSRASASCALQTLLGRSERRSTCRRRSLRGGSPLFTPVSPRRPSCPRHLAARPAGSSRRPSRRRRRRRRQSGRRCTWSR